MAQEILALERRLLDPAIRASAKALDRLIDDDFLEVPSTGEPFDKDIVLEALPLQRHGPVRYELTDPYVQRLSTEIALIVYRVDRREGDGEPVASLRSSIWRRRHGRWQMCFHQGTPLSGSREEGTDRPRD